MESRPRRIVYFQHTINRYKKNDFKVSKTSEEEEVEQDEKEEESAEYVM